MTINQGDLSTATYSAKERGVVRARVCAHENKKNYRGGFAQAIYQLTGEFNTIKER